MIRKNSGIVILFLLTFFSCGKDNLNPYDILPEKTWEITNFYDKDTIKNKEFEGWQFLFMTNNDVKARKNSESMYGKWLVSTSRDGSTNLIFTFEKTPPFHHLARAWKVKSQSNSKLNIESADTTYPRSATFEPI